MKLFFLSKNSLKNQRGFSLIEMVIVVSIIGVLVAGILTGTNLYESSKLRRLSTEITQYATAINQFKQEYGYSPGDFPKAVDFWTATPSTGVTVTNGNGDGMTTWSLRFNGEDLYAWPHMTEAGLIPGSYSGLVTNSGVVHYTKGVNSPESSAFKSISFMLFFNHAYVYKKFRGLQLRVSGLSSNGLPTSPDSSFNAKEAQAIDLKIDDGIAYTGNLIVFTHAAGNCLDVDWTSSTKPAYVQSSNDRGCQLEWYLEKL